MVRVDAYWWRYRRSPQIGFWAIEADGHHWPVWVSRHRVAERAIADAPSEQVVR